MNLYHFLLSAIGCLIFLGCSKTEVMLMDPSKKYDRTRKVELLEEAPNKKYFVIAIIEGKGEQYDNGSQALELIRRKARKIGAHAVIRVNSRGHNVKSHLYKRPISVDGYDLVINRNTIVVRALAIRFIEE